MSRTLCLALLLVTAGCDTVSLGAPDGRFRTPGTDSPQAAIVTPDGAVVVGALVEGTIAPADGTIGYPAVVRFEGGDATAAVYRSGERAFAGVRGVADLGGALAVAMERDGEAAVYRADPDGDLDGVLVRLESGAGFIRDALARTPEGLVVAVYPAHAEDSQLYGIAPGGEVRWSSRIEGAQDVRAVSAAGDDVYALGSSTEGAIVARLGSGGEAVWRAVVPASAAVGVAAADDGVVAVVQVYTDGEARTDVVRFDASGDVRWRRTVATGAGRGEGAVVVLPDGGVAVGLSTDRGFENGTESSVVVLDAGGEGRQRIPVNVPGEDTTHVSALLVRPDGQLVAVLAVGPRQLGGYGGDDFDIEVRTLALGR